MRIAITLGYSVNIMLDVTASELEILQRVLDKAVPIDRWYGDSDPIKCADPDEAARYNIRLVGARHPVVAYTKEASNG